MLYFVLNLCVAKKNRFSAAVSIEGEPQPFDSIKNHSRKDIVNRTMRTLTAAQWDKYLAGLRNLNILAAQAFEFEYNKNRTEGI